jgi:hypothetical protein
MTVLELYTAALALLEEEVARAKSYNKFKIPIINQIIAECFDVNNSIRVADGLEPFDKTQIPLVSKDEDVIPYDIQLLRECMPYGVASRLVVGDDKSIATAYSQQYEQYKSSRSCAVPEQICNVY